MLNVVIPMAGKGSRFITAGYSFPKPLIDVNNKPMIQVVVDNIGLEAKYIFLVLKEHYDQYALKYLLPLITKPNPCEIVIVDKVTEGAACTVLLAKELINNNDELILANSDQWVNWEPEHFLKYVREKNVDGSILTFNSTHIKWSYAKINDEGFVTEVAEKKPISNIATTGIYYFKHGKYFVQSAEQMINKNIRTNGEFYVCPVFNELVGTNDIVNGGGKVVPYPVAEMKGLGTPEDLKQYLENL